MDELKTSGCTLSAQQIEPLSAFRKDLMEVVGHMNSNARLSISLMQKEWDEARTEVNELARNTRDIISTFTAAAGPASLHRAFQLLSARADEHDSMLAQILNGNDDWITRQDLDETASHLAKSLADTASRLLFNFETKYDDKVVQMIARSLARIFPAGPPAPP